VGRSNLYLTSIGQPAPGINMAFAVSLDRPFADEGGAGELFMMELPLISWLAHGSYDVSYTTDYDLSIRPQDQPVPRAVLFGGHAEYWGIPLRDWLDQHERDAGDMGLGVFGADTHQC